MRWSQPGEESQNGKVSPHFIEPLSAAEARVARMVAWGMSNREIADALVLSRNTIKTHVSAALGKMQMRNRTELAVFMAKHRMEVQGE